MKKYTIGFIALILSFSCSPKKDKTSYDESTYSSTIDDTEKNYDYQNNDDYFSTQVYEDGTYEAKIEYYNPKTGTYSTYTLDVEVENDELVKIYWNNGGWLDESHFYATDISTGTASFTSDRGYEYTVTLLE